MLKFFILLFSISLFSQIPDIPDTTFVDKINFDKDINININKNINLKYLYEEQNKLSNINLEYNINLEKTILKYKKYTFLPKVYGLLKYYQPIFENTLNYYNLPNELMFIALIESNLNPQAGSKVGAQGLWQFMPATGKEFGLYKNNNINLFYDPYFSTDAACRYLSYLFKILNDWNLVIASYNCGQGRVLNLIKKHGTKDILRLYKFLPKETKDYIMRFHTVKYLYLNYNFYYDYNYNISISFKDIKEIKINENTNFKDFCKKNKLILDLIYFLNPHIITEYIPKNCFIYYLK